MTEHRPQNSDSDSQSDDRVAESRAGRDEDGDYVGRTGADDDFDAGETGAEARSNDS